MRGLPLEGESAAASERLGNDLGYVRARFRAHDLLRLDDLYGPRRYRCGGDEPHIRGGCYDGGVSEARAASEDRSTSAAGQQGHGEQHGQCKASIRMHGPSMVAAVDG